MALARKISRAIEKDRELLDLAAFGADISEELEHLAYDHKTTPSVIFLAVRLALRNEALPSL
jgi:hypothetical protein